MAARLDAMENRLDHTAKTEIGQINERLRFLLARAGADAAMARRRAPTIKDLGGFRED